MGWLILVSYVSGGAFLANALPHFVSGVTGRSFQSPFAKPPGQGLSSPAVNVLWGFFNFAVAYVLICHIGHFDLTSPVDAGAAGLGMLLLGLLCARMFGRLHGGNTPEAS